jgi:cardiolipin synthase A/B
MSRAGAPVRRFGRMPRVRALRNRLGRMPPVRALRNRFGPMPRVRALRNRLGLSPRTRVFDGNHVRLLAGGAEFFPALIAAIEGSRRQILIETYIIWPDDVGLRVVAALSAAALRGVAVRLVVDGYGGGEFARELVTRLGADGAEVRIYRRERWWQRFGRHLFRRLHRKMVLVDDTTAFVGGINLIDDHTHPGSAAGDLGPRFDFAVVCQGPIVGPIGRAMKRLWWTRHPPGAPRGRRPRRQVMRQRTSPPFADGVPASLLLRDNLRHRRTIERAYLAAIDGATREILIASAYFIPGRRFRNALEAAVARGVRVRLLLQGRIEYRLQHFAQEALYDRMLAAGIEINVYEKSFLHAKAAVIDDDWATVGSSNIDPFSLLLAREANLCVRDRVFAGQLRGHLETALISSSRRVLLTDHQRQRWFVRASRWLALVAVRAAVQLVASRRDY